ATRDRPGHPGPAGGLQPPDRRTRRRGDIDRVRREPDQSRIRGLRSEARRSGRPHRAPVRGCAWDGDCASATLLRVPSLFRRKSSDLVTDAVSEANTRAGNGNRTAGGRSGATGSSGTKAGGAGTAGSKSGVSKTTLGAKAAGSKAAASKAAAS